MSQPFFREALKHMPSKINNRPSNFFQRVVNAIAKALRTLTGKDRTLYDDANKAIRRILNTEAKEEIVNSVEDLDDSLPDNITQVNEAYGETGDILRVDNGGKEESRYTYYKKSNTVYGKPLTDMD